MKTVVQQLLEIIPDASEIKQFISENDADTKMLDEWLGKRIYDYKDWVKLEKEQIIDAYIECWSNDGGIAWHKALESEQYYSKKYSALS